MKTHFPILWIDDNRDFVNSLKTPLARWMESQGFVLDLEYLKDGKKVKERLKKLESELIVIDYNMPIRGDELITNIRDANFYQDIVFYSQGGRPVGSFALPPDGVFFVAKDDAKERIKSLIELKIRRASDLATLRGWIVADAIELESILGNVLGKCFKDNEDLFVNRVLCADNLFDFGKKHLVLAGIIGDMIAKYEGERVKPAKFEQLKKCKTILNKFPEEIIQIRNALAHQHSESSEGGIPVVKTKTKKPQDIPITPVKCAEIRQNINKHHNNLLELQKLM